MSLIAHALMNGGAIFCNEREWKRNRVRNCKIMTHPSHILDYAEPLDMSFSCLLYAICKRKIPKITLIICEMWSLQSNVLKMIMFQAIIPMMPNNQTLTFTPFSHSPLSKNYKTLQPLSTDAVSDGYRSIYCHSTGLVVALLPWLTSLLGGSRASVGSNTARDLWHSGFASEMVFSASLLQSYYTRSQVRSGNQEKVLYIVVDRC